MSERARTQTDRLIPVEELPWPARWSAAVYQHIILGAYPADFIEEFGDEMAVTFGNNCADAYDSWWLLGVVWVWMVTLWTLLGSVLTEWQEQGIQAWIKPVRENYEALDTRFEIIRNRIATTISLITILSTALYFIAGILG